MANHGIVQIGVKEEISADQLKIAPTGFPRNSVVPRAAVGLDLRIGPDLGLGHNIGNLPGVVNVSHFSEK